MLNSVLRNKIQFPDVRLLYETCARLPNPKFREELTRIIRSVRNQFRVKSDISVLDKIEEIQGKTRKYKVRKYKYVSLEGSAKDDGADPLVVKLTKYKETGAWYKARLKELEAIIYNIEKRPPETNLGQWRSIEFEMVFVSKAAQTEFVTFVRSNGWSGAGKTPKVLVTMKTDGSVHPNRGDEGALPVEMIVSYVRGNEEVVHRICKFLRGDSKEKRRAYVNKTCGTHVHFDMRHLDVESVKNYGKRLTNAIPALWKILPKSRSQATYCKSGMSDISSSGDRYTFVNMTAWSKYKTIEVRAHSGTINARKILNWISVCETIMVGNNLKRLKKNETISEVETLIENYEFDTSVARFIRERFDHFNGKDTEEDSDDHFDTETMEAPGAIPNPAPVPNNQVNPVNGGV